MKRITCGECKMRGILAHPLYGKVYGREKKMSGWNNLNIWIWILPQQVTGTSLRAAPFLIWEMSGLDRRIPMFPSSLRILRLDSVSPAKTYLNRIQPGPWILFSVCSTARETAGSYTGRAQKEAWYLASCSWKTHTSSTRLPRFPPCSGQAPIPCLVTHDSEKIL